MCVGVRGLGGGWLGAKVVGGGGWVGGGKGSGVCVGAKVVGVGRWGAKVVGVCGGVGEVGRWGQR